MKWAVFIPAHSRPTILTRKHADWPKFLRWIPRSLNAFIGSAPRKLWGNAPEDRSWCALCVQARAEAGMKGSNPYCGVARRYPKPIPDSGKWWIGLPLYLAVTTKRGIHARIGFRYDDVDGYYNLTIEPYKRYRASDGAKVG